MVTPLQQAGGTSATLTVAVSFSSNLSAGTKLIAFVSNDKTSTISTVKDTAGNSFVQLTSNNANANEASFIYVLDTPAGDVGATTTITATFTGTANGVGMIIMEVPGLLAGTTSAILDGTAGIGQGNSVLAASPGTNLTVPAYSSTVAGEFLVLFQADNGDTTGSTVTTPSGYTASTGNTTNDSNDGDHVFYKNSTGGSEAPATIAAIDAGNAFDWNISFVAFKLAPPGVTWFNNNPGGTLRRAKQRMRQTWFGSPPPAVAAPLTTPFPIVVAAPNAQQWYGPNATGRQVITNWNASQGGIATTGNMTEAPLTMQGTGNVQYVNATPIVESVQVDQRYGPNATGNQVITNWSGSRSGLDAPGNMTLASLTMQGTANVQYTNAQPIVVSVTVPGIYTNPNYPVVLTQQPPSSPNITSTGAMTMASLTMNGTVDVENPLITNPVVVSGPPSRLFGNNPTNVQVISNPTSGNTSSSGSVTEAPLTMSGTAFVQYTNAQPIVVSSNPDRSYTNQYYPQAFTQQPPSSANISSNGAMTEASLTMSGTVDVENPLAPKTVQSSSSPSQHFLPNLTGIQVIRNGASSNVTSTGSATLAPLTMLGTAFVPAPGTQPLVVTHNPEPIWFKVQPPQALAGAIPPLFPPVFGTAGMNMGLLTTSGNMLLVCNGGMTLASLGSNGVDNPTGTATMGLGALTAFGEDHFNDDTDWNQDVITYQPPLLQHERGGTVSSRHQTGRLQ